MKSKQKGISPIGILFAVALFGLIVTVVLKLSTHYIEYYSTRSVFQHVAEDPANKDATPDTLRAEISRNLLMSQIRDFDFKDAFIGKDNDKMIVEFSYEKREHIALNIDIVATFKYSAEVK